MKFLPGSDCKQNYFDLILAVKTLDVGKAEREKQRQYLLSQKLSLYQIPDSINCDTAK